MTNFFAVVKCAKNVQKNAKKIIFQSFFIFFDLAVKKRRKFIIVHVFSLHF